MRQRLMLGTTLTAALLVAGLTATPAGQREERVPEEKRASYAEMGLASYYGARFDRLLTASGERFDMHDMTGAHRSLPFGTRVRVTNLRNGRSAVVRINDRGPFVKGRVVDVSHAAAHELRLLARGIERVRLEILPPHRRSAQRPSGESG